MNRTLPVAVALAAGVALLLWQYTGEQTPGETHLGLYTQLESALNDGGIIMSTPLILDESELVSEYCGFFSGADACTTSELRDSKGKFIGNIHAIGRFTTPDKLIAAVQIGSALDGKEAAKTVFAALVNVAVCPCWERPDPEGATMNDWAEAHITAHVESGMQSSSSNTLLLDGRGIQMSIITNGDGYEWQITVSGPAP